MTSWDSLDPTVGLPVLRSWESSLVHWEWQSPRPCILVAELGYAGPELPAWMLAWPAVSWGCQALPGFLGDIVPGHLPFSQGLDVPG